MVMSLNELLQQCIVEAEGDKVRGTKRFLIAAKKQDPNVTMTDCMSAAGYNDADPKKAANLAQTFRTKILNPLRDHLAKVKFQIHDTNPIFGRTGVKRTKEQSDIRKSLLAYLPALTRTRVAAAEADGDWGYIDDLIADNNGQNIENNAE